MCTLHPSDACSRVSACCILHMLRSEHYSVYTVCECSILADTFILCTNLVSHCVLLLTCGDSLLQAARQAEEEAQQQYYAQQQAEVASSGRKNSGKSQSFSQAGSEYSQGMPPQTPSKKPYDDKKNTNFFGLKKKGSHDLAY